MDRLREYASFYRAGLLLGLIPGEAAIAWAEVQIARERTTSPAVLKLVLTNPKDLTELRRNLLPLATAVESPVVGRALLGIIQRDLTARLRSLADTTAVLAQLRKSTTVATEHRSIIDALTESMMLAAAGVEGDITVIGNRIGAWLEQFKGAEHAFATNATEWSELTFDDRSTAAAFLGAFSRVVAGPTRLFLTPTRIEVFAQPAVNGGMTFFLTDGAVARAEAAFGPMPVETHLGALPGNAVRILSGDKAVAMGHEAAQRHLTQLSPG